MFFQMQKVISLILFFFLMTFKQSHFVWKEDICWLLSLLIGTLLGTGQAGPKTLTTALEK